MVKTQTNDSAFNISGLVPNFSNILMIIPHMQATIARGFLRQQKEILSFFDNRCDADIEFVGSISKAKDMKEIYEAYSSFVREAAKEYAEEAINEADASSVTLVDVTSEIRSVTGVADIDKKAKKSA